MSSCYGPTPPPPAHSAAYHPVAPAYCPADVSYKSECSFGEISCCAENVPFGLIASRRVSADNYPRVEHLASAAIPYCAIQLNASGVATVTLPTDFDGAALVMMSSDASCEWQIVHASSSPPTFPPSLLQRQLSLARSFPLDSHMSLQVMIIWIVTCNTTDNYHISHQPSSCLLVKKCQFLMTSVACTRGLCGDCFLHYCIIS